MIDPSTWTEATLDDDRPRLLVVVDTEEEFDWALPHDRNSTAVTAMSAQHRAHEVFSDYGLVPTYVIDWPVVSQEEGYTPLRELHEDGLCEIGAHLHPWVSPPHDEDVNNRNSYPGNLPADLEREKLNRLTDEIATRFGKRPVVYKAGRYGAGPNTASILEDLGYVADTSVLAGTDLTAEEGPDFVHCGAAPYWFGTSRRLLEVPMTVGFVGALHGRGGAFHRTISGGALEKMHVPGILARAGLFERITLTPEGITHEEHRRLTSALLKRGHRVFSFTYHSPSLEPEHTPYVRSADDLKDFLDKFRRYFDWFFGELGGVATTPRQLAEEMGGKTP